MEIDQHGVSEWAFHTPHSAYFVHTCTYLQSASFLTFVLGTFTLAFCTSVPIAQHSEQAAALLWQRFRAGKRSQALSKDYRIFSKLAFAIEILATPPVLAPHVVISEAMAQSKSSRKH